MIESRKAQEILEAIQLRGPDRTVYHVLHTVFNRSGGYRAFLAEIVLSVGQGVEELLPLLREWQRELPKVRKTGARPYMVQAPAPKGRLTDEDKRVYALLREAATREFPKALDIVHILCVELRVSYGFRVVLLELSALFGVDEFRSFMAEFEERLAHHRAEGRNPYLLNVRPHRKERLTAQEARMAGVILDVLPGFNLHQLLQHEFAVTGEFAQVLEEVAARWPNRGTAPTADELRRQWETEEQAITRASLSGGMTPVRVYREYACTRTLAACYFGAIFSPIGLAALSILVAGLFFAAALVGM